MFPSVPIDKKIYFLKYWLREQVKVKEILNLLKLCISQNVFQFQNKLYGQIEDTAMGNPLSAFVAEDFLSRFKKKIKTTYVTFLKIWIRYVDEIFAEVATVFNTEIFIHNLNSYYPLIKFTYGH